MPVNWLGLALREFRSLQATGGNDFLWCSLVHFGINLPLTVKCLEWAVNGVTAVNRTLRSVQAQKEN